MGIAPLHAGDSLDGPITHQVFGKSRQQLFTQVRVRDFAAAELHHRLDAIALLQKSDGVVSFELIVVLVGVGAELEFLHLYDVLFLLRLMLLLLLLVLVMTEIDRLGDGRPLLGLEANIAANQMYFVADPAEH